MKVAATNNFCNRPSFGAEEPNKSNYTEAQTKQALRDSFEAIKDETIQKAAQEINGRYKDQFVRQIEESKKGISTQDVVNIFSLR